MTHEFVLYVVYHNIKGLKAGICILHYMLLYVFLASYVYEFMMYFFQQLFGWDYVSLDAFYLLMWHFVHHLDTAIQCYWSFSFIQSDVLSMILLIIVCCDVEHMITVWNKGGGEGDLMNHDSVIHLLHINILGSFMLYGNGSDNNIDKTW